jgi:hypothetical protein
MSVAGLPEIIPSAYSGDVSKFFEDLYLREEAEKAKPAKRYRTKKDKDDTIEQCMPTRTSQRTRRRPKASDSTALDGHRVRSLGFKEGSASPEELIPVPEASNNVLPSFGTFPGIPPSLLNLVRCPSPAASQSTFRSAHSSLTPLPSDAPECDPAPAFISPPREIDAQHAPPVFSLKVKEEEDITDLAVAANPCFRGHTMSRLRRSVRVIGSMRVVSRSRGTESYTETQWCSHCRITKRDRYSSKFGATGKICATCYQYERKNGRPRPQTLIDAQARRLAK